MKPPLVPHPRRAAGSASAALLRRLAPLWAHETPLSIARRPGRPGVAEDFLVLPRLSNPILLVPAHRSPAASSIQALAPGLRGRVLAAAYRSGLLRRLPVPRLRVPEGASSPMLTALEGMVPGTRHMIIRLGRDRPGRAVVVTCLGGDGEALGIGKLGAGTGKASIAAEHGSLVRLQDLRLTLVRAPRAMGLTEAGDGALLAMSVLTGEEAPLDPDDPWLHAAMTEVARSGGTRKTTLGDARQVHELRTRLETRTDNPATAWIRPELDRLLSRRGDTVVEVGLWHGDWVSWNQRRSDGCLALWDWENLAEGVPLGMDYVHYAAQHLRRLRGTDPVQEQRWLALVREGLGRRWGLTRGQIDATLVLYLLVVNTRYADERAEAPDAPARQGWTRSLVQELNRE